MDMHTAAPPKDIERYRGMVSKGRPGARAYVVLLGLDTFDLPGLLKLIDRGFTWSTFQRFVRNTGLTTEQVAELIAIPRRTLARRKTDRRLNANESDRLVRAARLISRALDLFEGDRASVVEWLTESNTALGGVTPLHFARTELGAEEVEHLIGRIEYGVYS